MNRRRFLPHVVPSAFTLTEALVVIAVCCVLLALLLPALQSAQEMSRSSACLSNLRQHGIALNGYSTDNHGFIAPVNRAASTTQEKFNSIVYLMIDGGYVPMPGKWLQSYESGYAKPQDGIWLCPSVDPGTASLAGTAGGGYGYNMRHLHGAPMYGVPVVQTRRLTRPGAVISTADSQWYDAGEPALNAGKFCFSLTILDDLCRSWSSGGAVYAQVVPPRHTGNGNSVYADGHASANSYPVMWASSDDCFGHLKK